MRELARIDEGHDEATMPRYETRRKETYIAKRSPVYASAIVGVNRRVPQCRRCAVFSFNGYFCGFHRNSMEVTGSPMEVPWKPLLPWISYGSPVLIRKSHESIKEAVREVLWNSMEVSRISHGIPMEIPWVFQGSPLGCSREVSRKSHGSPTEGNVDSTGIK